MRQRNVGPQSGSMLRRLARTLLLCGATVAVACTLYAGRHNASVLLMALFVVWVSSPFFGFLMAERWAERMRANIAATVHASALLITVFSVAIYAFIAFGPPRQHVAFAFLVVPAASWLAIAPLLVAAKFATKR